MSNLHIVTVATESKFYFPYLVESCKKNGKKLEILGFGTEWKGYNYKFKLIIEYLHKLPENDIVCFVDGYDVLCIRELYQLPSVFVNLKTKHNCKMIVGYDNTDNILLKIINQMTFGSCKNSYINSGTYIGYVKDVLEIIKKVYNLNAENKADDQVLLTKYCTIRPNDIYIDEGEEIFLNLIRQGDLSNHVEIKNKQILHKGKHPFFIHAAGGMSHLDNIIPKLGYEYNDNIGDQLISVYYKKFFYYLRLNLIYIFIAIVVIILIIYAIIANKKKIYKFFSKKIK
jgi:hypothetical protein